MKKIITVLITLFFKQYLISQIYPIDYNHLDLKGNVKSVIEFSYKAKDYFGDVSSFPKGSSISSAKSSKLQKI